MSPSLVRCRAQVDQPSLRRRHGPESGGPKCGRSHGRRGESSPSSDVARAFRASPTANSVGARRRKESPVSALRTRDLSSHDLWERSLNRSRERRRVAAIHRKTAPRRKGVSLAISAALLTTPILPSFAAAQSAGGGPAPTGDAGGDDQGRPAPPASLLEIGSTGEAVRKLQRQLGLVADGIYGPQTREAVLRFQRHAGL